MEHSLETQKYKICSIRESVDELTDDLIVVINKINHFLTEIDKAKHTQHSHALNKKQHTTKQTY